MPVENAEATVTRSHEVFMEGLYWWGIPTLFRCPYAETLADCDIALVGVPHSTGNGTTERDQHLGPRAVRDISALGRRVHMRYGLDPWTTARVRDLGDVPLPEGNNNEKSIEHIADFYRALDAAETPAVSIGGDHSITGGILQAFGGRTSKLSKGEKVSLLHFDAHTDAFQNMEHFLGARKSAAHWAAYLVTDEHVDATRSVQVGIRGNPRTLDWLEPSYDLGYEVITMERYAELGPARCIEIIRERLEGRPVYVTFDLDCLDPTVAPGVANIEAGTAGFTAAQAIELIQAARGMNVIGGDVVCLMPTRDNPNRITAMVANAILFEVICLIADRLRPGQSGSAAAS